MLMDQRHENIHPKCFHKRKLGHEGFFLLLLLWLLMFWIICMSPLSCTKQTNTDKWPHFHLPILLPRTEITHSYSCFDGVFMTLKLMEAVIEMLDSWKAGVTQLSCVSSSIGMSHPPVQFDMEGDGLVTSAQIKIQVFILLFPACHRIYPAISGGWRRRRAKCWVTLVWHKSCFVFGITKVGSIIHRDYTKGPMNTY